MKNEIKIRAFENLAADNCLFCSFIVAFVCFHLENCFCLFQPIKREIIGNNRIKVSINRQGIWGKGSASKLV